MPAYANGHKHVGNLNGPLRTRFADPDAGWGHRSSISTRKGGAFYGFKLHMAICTQTELPLAWTVTAAGGPEQGEVGGLLDSVMERGFAAQVAVLDKGYDGQPMHDVCESRGIRPRDRAQGDPCRQGRPAQAPVLRPRRVDLCRVRRQARRVQVALPHG
jgi:hypothetical protein